MREMRKGESECVRALLQGKMVSMVMKLNNKYDSRGVSKFLPVFQRVKAN